MAWPRWLRPTSAAASGLVLASGLAAPQRAAARDWRLSGDAGIYVGYRFGAGVGRFAFGIEGRGVEIDRAWDCDGYAGIFAGAVARLEVDSGNQQRLTLGPTFGSSNGAGYAFDASAGYLFGSDAGPVAQLGAEGMFLFFDSRVAYSVGRDWLVAGGLRFPPLSVSSFCVTGRRLRRDDGPAPLAGATLATLARRADGPAAEAGVDSSARAARVWTERACFEWASVPAFCELAAQLRACDAPAALVQRARDAAADELRHAVIAAGLAGDLVGTGAISLDPPAADRRAPALGRAGLVRLGVESFLDGCITEATAAAIAADEAAGTSDPSVRGAQSTIAADEARHAALGWAILEWAAAVDPDGVRPALRAAIAARTPAETNSDALDGLTSFGILGAHQAGAIAAREEHRAHQRLQARLAR